MKNFIILILLGLMINGTSAQAQSPEKLGSIIDAVMTKGDAAKKRYSVMLSSLRTVRDSKTLEAMVTDLDKVEMPMKEIMAILDDMADAARAVEEYSDEPICYNTGEHAGEGSDEFYYAFGSIEEAFAILDRFTQVEDLEEGKGQLLEVESIFADTQEYMTNGLAHMQLAKSELVNCGKEIEDDAGIED